MPTRHRAILILSALCLLAVGSFMLALMVGSFKVAPADVLATLLGQEGSGGEVVIEDGASMASGAKIVAGSASLEGETCSAAAPVEQQIVERSKVVLKKNATLFTNSVVLPGVTVGEGAALAAGSVATRDIPDGELWGGVPARFMRKCK